MTVCTASSRTTPTWHFRVSLEAQLNPGFNNTFQSQELLWTCVKSEPENAPGEETLIVSYTWVRLKAAVDTMWESFSLALLVLMHPLCHIHLSCHQQVMSPPWCLPRRALTRADRICRKVQLRQKLYENRSNVFQLLLEAQSEILQWLPLFSCPYISQSLGRLFV